MSNFKQFRYLFILLGLAAIGTIVYFLYENFFSSPKTIIRPTYTMVVTDALQKNESGVLPEESKDFFRIFNACYKDTIFVPYSDSRLVYLNDSKNQNLLSLKISL